jgi:formylmethanofuran dehydrogenase subunit B
VTPVFIISEVSYEWVVGIRMVDFPCTFQYNILMLSERIDRTQITIEKRDTLDSRDAEYWNRVTIKEKLQAITFLRECFYGKEATTGRLQRVHTMLKLK